MEATGSVEYLDDKSVWRASGLDFPFTLYSTGRQHHVHTCPCKKSMSQHFSEITSSLVDKMDSSNTHFFRSCCIYVHWITRQFIEKMQDAELPPCSIALWVECWALQTLPRSRSMASTSLVSSKAKGIATSKAERLEPWSIQGPKILQITESSASSQDKFSKNRQPGVDAHLAPVCLTCPQNEK